MVSETWQGARRILAVCLGSAGDVVMLAPALRSIQAALPDSEITLLASEAGSQASPLLQPWLFSEAWIWPVNWERGSKGSVGSLVKRIRAGGFEAAAIFTRYNESPYVPAYICYLAGVPIRLGQSKEFGGGVLSEWIKPPPDGVHQVTRNLFLLQSAGFPPADRHLSLALPSSVASAVKERLRQNGLGIEKGFILLVPKLGRCDVDFYRDVATLLAAETGQTSVLVEPDGAADFERVSERVYRVGGVSWLGQVALMAQACLSITDDWDLVAVADAWECPVMTFAPAEQTPPWYPRRAAFWLETEKGRLSKVVAASQSLLSRWHATTLNKTKRGTTA